MYLKNISFALLSLLASINASSASFCKELKYANLGFFTPDGYCLDYTATLNNMANVHFRKGKYNLALKTYQQCHKIRQQRLDEKHPHYIATLYNIALTYAKQRKYTQALKKYEQCRKLYEKQQATAHPHYAKVLNDIASIYYCQKNYILALSLYLQCRNIYETQLGTDHPLYARVLNNIANVYFRQGNYTQALQTYTTSTNIYEKKLDTYYYDYLDYSIVVKNTRICHMKKTRIERMLLKKHANILPSQPDPNDPTITLLNDVPQGTHTEQSYTMVANLLASYLAIQHIGK